MKRKIVKALTCISILFLMMTGCGNAATANAEPDALAESELEAAFMADSGQKVVTSAAADKVSDSVATASTSSAESRSATEPRATAEPKTTAEPKATADPKASAGSRTSTEPKASADSKSAVGSKSATESSSTATDTKQATESRQETDSKSGSASIPTAPASTPAASASTPTAPASTPAAPTSTPAASAPASSSTCNHNFTIQIHNENYDGCTGRSYSARVCTKCGYEEIVDDTGIVEVHSYGAGIWLKEPTCTESGEQYHVCSKCGKEGDHFSVSAVASNHNYVKSGETIMYAGSCDKQSIVQVTYSCTGCGDSYTQDEFGDYGDHCDDNGDGICDDCGTVCGEPVPEQPVPEQPSADGAQSVGE